MKTAVAIYLRDEAGLVAEWTAHYLALGFAHLYLQLNGSSDGTREIIETAARARPDAVRLIEWPDSICETHDERQRLAFNNALALARDDGVEWMLACDTDEFLMSPVGETVTTLLRRLDHRAAIGFNWCLYGSNGHIKQPRGLVTEAFLRRATESFDPARIIKSFVRVPYTQGFWGPHHASLDFPYVNARDELIGWTGLGGVVNVGAPPRMSPWRMAHYFCQSAEHWARKAIRSNAAKGFVTRDHAVFQTHDRNDEFDPTALLYSAGIREMLGEMGLPEPAWPEPVVSEPVRMEWAA